MRIIEKNTVSEKSQDLAMLISFICTSEKCIVSKFDIDTKASVRLQGFKMSVRNNSTGAWKDSVFYVILQTKLTFDSSWSQKQFGIDDGLLWTTDLNQSMTTITDDCLSLGEVYHKYKIYDKSKKIEALKEIFDWIKEN